ncbi:MAG: PilT/PilU family type 4a pilus ATPase [Trueperaceae bacterium]|nr:PilT/PilU family type 4a pilus ATPase [Trueperaceae bacterium]
MTFNEMLAQFVAQGASDIHLHTGLKPLLRINGKLKPIGENRLTDKVTRAFVDIMCDEDQKEEFRNNHQIDLAYGVPKIGRFRVNLFKQRGSVSAVLRVVNSDEEQLEVVNLPDDTLDFFRDKTKGIMLVTGATGSGKSTTLARILNEINLAHEKMIVTIEDPIEYLHRPKSSIIVQREIGTDAVSFSRALVAAMRQDPDVIMIGEIRDHATAAAAIEAAQTGHYVLSTMHTQDTVRTVNRMLDLFPPNERHTARLLFAESIVGIVSQQLLPRKGGGRVAAMEVLKGNLRIRDLIKDESRTNELYDAIRDSRADGMQTFDDHLSELYEQDLIEFGTGYLAATSGQTFKMKATQIDEARDRTTPKVGSVAGD